MIPERWVPIPGFEGFYEVSDLGRVRSVDRDVTRGGNVHRLRGVVLAADALTKGIVLDLQTVADGHYARIVGKRS